LYKILSLFEAQILSLFEADKIKMILL